MGRRRRNSHSLIDGSLDVVIAVSQELSHSIQQSARVMQARIEGPSVSGRKRDPSAMRCDRAEGGGTEAKPTASALSLDAFVIDTNCSAACCRRVDVDVDGMFEIECDRAVQRLVCATQVDAEHGRAAQGR
jgi:hypothetical protein